LLFFNILTLRNLFVLNKNLPKISNKKWAIGKIKYLPLDEPKSDVACVVYFDYLIKESKLPKLTNTQLVQYKDHILDLFKKNKIGKLIYSFLIYLIYYLIKFKFK